MLFQAFGTDALWLQRQAAAGRACQRRRLPRTAVVALQATAATMHGHRCIAAVAGRGPAAVMAQQHRCVATAVLEHQHLLAPLQVLADAGQNIGREAIVQWPFAHIKDAHARWSCIAGTLLQAQVGVAPGIGVVQGFQRGRGTAEQHGNAERLGAHQGEIARVVADAVLLLVAAVMFLVDDQQTGLRQRREHCRAGADNDACFTT